jgi:hypothetical protein
MLKRRFLFALAVSALVWLLSCAPPDCIDCTNHSGDLPKTVICQDTYEALPQTPKLSWSEFSNRAIEQGCEPANR